MEEFEALSRDSARRRVNVIAFSAGVFMIVQFGVIFQFVYTVCRVMAPSSPC
jgi:hypothetical protein